MRSLNIMLVMILVLFGAQISAGENVSIGTQTTNSQTGESDRKKWYYPFEISELKIKQSNDGSGIIREVTCLGCDYRFVKITSDTEVVVNGQKVDLLRARERAGQQAYIEFDRDTAVVKGIYWAE